MLETCLQPRLDHLLPPLPRKQIHPNDAALLNADVYRTTDLLKVAAVGLEAWRLIGDHLVG